MRAKARRIKASDAIRRYDVGRHGNRITISTSRCRRTARIKLAPPPHARADELILHSAHLFRRRYNVGVRRLSCRVQRQKSDGGGTISDERKAWPYSSPCQSANAARLRESEISRRDYS